MADFYSKNGKVEHLPLHWLEGRGFRLGIRPFTTLKFDGVKPELWELHLERLMTAMEAWGAKRQLKDCLTKEWELFLGQLRQPLGVRIDLILLQEAGEFDWFATTRNLIPQPSEVMIVIFSDEHRSIRDLGEIKYADYLREELLRQEIGRTKEIVYEDVFFGLQEATTSNIFLFKGDDVILPTPGPKGILKGIYSRAFCDFLRSKGVTIKTGAIRCEDFSTEALLILTNCISGLKRARLESSQWSVKQNLLWAQVKEYEREFINLSKNGELPSM